MNQQMYLWCSILGLIGIAFQTLIKINKLQTQSKLANHAFKIRDYFENDWTTILLNLLTLAVAVISIDEVVKYKPQVVSFIKWFFFFIGYTGSSILNSLLSKTQDGLNKIIDIKSNIADNKIEKP